MEYSSQFPQPQPAFRGFGDQAMRSHRVTPAPQPAPAPAAPSRAQGVQSSLFSADEIRNPQGPAAPTFNASQFRVTRHALPGMAAGSFADQRVPAPERERPARPQPTPTSGPGWSQPQLHGMGPTPSSTSHPAAAGPNPTNWPTPAPAPAAPSPTPTPRTVTINRAAYNATGARFGPASTPGARVAAPAVARPAAPSAGSTFVPSGSGLNTPPGRPSARTAVTAAARAGSVTQGTAPRTRMTGAQKGALAGFGVTLAAKSLQSMNRIGTDPARSGNPLFKTSGGWSKS
ncbi:hypothetical protein ACFYWN_27065 [Streptomyces sp. NPDC002917]|uniref:hypothetical protein n=1 Tax=Streptomyces sp. NPDC002917 TaxID=3364671 RepID=UPI0036A35A85